MTTLRRAFELLPVKLRRGWIAVGLLSAVAAAAEAAGAGVVFLLVKILSDPAAVLSEVEGSALGHLLAAGDPNTLLRRSTVLCAIFYVAKNLFQALVAYLHAGLVGRSIRSLALTAFEASLAAPYAFHLRRRSVDLVQHATEGATRIAEGVLSPSAATLSEALVACGVVAVLLAASPTWTFVALALLGTLGASVILLSRNRLSALGGRELAARRHALGVVQQALRGIREVRVMGAEKQFLDSFASHQNDLSGVKTASGVFSFLPRLVIETVFILATLVVIWWVGQRPEMNEDLIPLLGLYAYAGFRIIPTCNRLIVHLNTLRFGLPAVAQLTADLDAIAEVTADSGSPVGAFGFKSDLRLVKVGFHYEGMDTPTLSGIDLTIEPGEVVAIVGATGSGKTTLIDLILGLLEPTSGQILIDGIELGKVRSSWQRQLGYVPQSIFLLEDSLRANVTFGARPESTDERRVLRALTEAGLGEFLATQRQGLDTPLGENGVHLSGGQRQLVAIARALYREPRVLIFDEATSSLDPPTEQEVSQAIDRLRHTRTLIVVTHRLDSVRGSDRVVVLSGGRKVAEGPYDELARESSDFRRLAGLGGGE